MALERDDKRKQRVEYSLSVHRPERLCGVGGDRSACDYMPSLGSRHGHSSAKSSMVEVLGMRYAVLILLAIAGCATVGVLRDRTVTEYDQAGRKVRTIREKTRVDLPDESKDNSNIAISDSEVVATISGNYPPPVSDKVAEETTESGMYLAGLFAFISVGLFVARVKVPYIPLVAPFACAGASAAFFMLPTILDRYAAEIGIFAAVVVLWALYETWHQRRLHKADPGASVGLEKWYNNRNKRTENEPGGQNSD